MGQTGLSLPPLVAMKGPFDFSVLFGGKAGDGIRQLGVLWAKLLNRRGLKTFLYDDYPSLIRGGHNFSIVRAAEFPISAHRDQVNVIVALNEDTIRQHQQRLSENGVVLCDQETPEAQKAPSAQITVPWAQIVKELSAPKIMKNTAALASLARFCQIPWEELAQTLRELPKTELNLSVAQKSYELSEKGHFDFPSKEEKQYFFFGNETIALGAAAAGLKVFLAYPMTPASSILHYLAAHRERLGLNVIHPENEIAAVLAAIGAAYAGSPAMTATSGGGFALMVEALSLAGQAEIPLVIVECQRPGPSTGVPTYTMQGDLEFVLTAGHGEFPRVVLAPGDAQEAFELTAEALRLAWRYQTPVLVLSDKHLSESLFSQNLPQQFARVEYKAWSGGQTYARYAFSEDGVSPLAFPGRKDAVVKATSYEHDPFGITTEEATQIAQMQEKRLRKEKGLKRETEKMVGVFNRNASVALLCFGSTKGAAVEIAERLDLRLIRPLVLRPFPTQTLKKALEGVDRIIVCETNATGQLARLLSSHGFRVDQKILKYDGRPFSVDELYERVKELL